MRRLLYFSCPQCKQRGAVESKDREAQVVCKKCGHEFIASHGESIKLVVENEDGAAETTAERKSKTHWILWTIGLLIFAKTFLYYNVDTAFQQIVLRLDYLTASLFIIAGFFLRALQKNRP